MDLTLTVSYRNRLKALMAESGFRSMPMLASETGISTNMLYRFERGESELTIPNVLRLMWALGCTFEELIAEVEVTSDEPDDYDSLADDVKASLTAAEKYIQEYREK